MRTIPITAFIPTYNRGLLVLDVLQKLHACDPRPTEYLIHVDAADGILEGELKRQFPEVKVQTSLSRLGPGGGRHQCLLSCSSPYAVGFDDDSFPVDRDFFAYVEPLFLRYPRAAVIGASIWHRHQAEHARIDHVVRTASYTGCGYAIRLAAYREVRGTIPRPVPYEMEEIDLSLQLFASGWEIYEARQLRVFHDTELKHHESKEINAGTIANIGLFGYLHFPISHWGYGIFLRVANRILYSLSVGRFRGIIAGVAQIPIDCYRHRRLRHPIVWATIKEFMNLRRIPSDFKKSNIVVGQAFSEPRNAIWLSLDQDNRHVASDSDNPAHKS